MTKVTHKKRATRTHSSQSHKLEAHEVAEGRTIKRAECASWTQEKKECAREQRHTGNVVVYKQGARK